MTVSRVLALLIMIGLSPALAGCGVADLVAHGVKAVEKRNQAPSGEASSPAPQSSPDQTQADEPPPVRTPAPQRSTVTVEELPAR